MKPIILTATRYALHCDQYGEWALTLDVPASEAQGVAVLFAAPPDTIFRATFRSGKAWVLDVSIGKSRRGSCGEWRLPLHFDPMFAPNATEIAMMQEQTFRVEFIVAE